MPKSCLKHDETNSKGKRTKDPEEYNSHTHAKEYQRFCTQFSKLNVDSDRIMTIVIDKAVKNGYLSRRRCPKIELFNMWMSSGQSDLANLVADLEKSYQPSLTGVLP